MRSCLRYLLTAVLAVTSASPAMVRRATWPYGPLKVSGRDIVNAVGDKVVYVGVNWPGHNDAMIPEGLQYSSIAQIVSRVKSLGMNVIRLTYAIEMIDDILSNNENSTLENTLTRALGPQNGSAVLSQILKNNPSFTANTTRLQIFDEIARECNAQEILVHLDNHQSKGEWCCNAGDGNAWFGDTKFDTSNWKRGLAYMATHAKAWPAFVSTSLRNELRDPGEASPVKSKYGWADWYTNVVAAADGIHAANPEPLIFFSGLNFDTDLSNVTAGKPLNSQGQSFRIQDFEYADKIVFELHNYNNDLGDANCANFNMYNQGYNAMDLDGSAVNKAPVVLTEFGFPQDDSAYTRPYANCIKEYITSLPGGPGGWIQWALGGSYYIREGTVDYDETWGLFNHDWSAWRSQTTIDEYVKPFVTASLG